VASSITHACDLCTVFVCSTGLTLLFCSLYSTSRRDLGANKQYTITSVSIYNRSDCCRDRNNNSDIQLLDESGNIVATQTIEAGDVKSVYNFNFDSIQGRYVKVEKKTAGVFNIAEVEVIGY